MINQISWFLAQNVVLFNLISSDVYCSKCPVILSVTGLFLQCKIFCSVLVSYLGKKQIQGLIINDVFMLKGKSAPFYFNSHILIKIWFLVLCWKTAGIVSVFWFLTSCSSWLLVCICSGHRGRQAHQNHKSARSMKTNRTDQLIRFIITSINQSIRLQRTIHHYGSKFHS